MILKTNKRIILRIIQIGIPFLISLCCFIKVLHCRNLVIDMTSDVEYFHLSNNISNIEARKIIEENENLDISFFNIKENSLLINETIQTSHKVQKIEVLGTLFNIVENKNSLNFNYGNNCILSKDVALKLFGQNNVIGLSIVVEGKVYIVSAILNDVEDTALLHSNATNMNYDFVSIRGENISKNGNTKSQLENLGLEYQEVNTNLLVLLMSILLIVLFIFIVLFISKCTRIIPLEISNKLKWVIISVVIIIGCYCIFQNLYVPNEWIPSRWSNIDFWNGLNRSFIEDIHNIFKISMPNIILRPYMLTITASILCVLSLCSLQVAYIINLNYKLVEKFKDSNS